MSGIFDLIITPLFSNFYITAGLVALVLFLVGLALPEKTKNVNGTENDNKGMKTAFIVLGIVIGVIDAIIYCYMKKRKSSPVIPSIYYF